MPMGQAQRAVIAVLFCVAVWCAWQSRLSSQHPQASNYAVQAVHGGGSIIAQEKSPEKISDWLLVALNFCLVGSTLLLWLASNRSAKIAERALTELERPYLFILDYNWLLIEQAKDDGHKSGLVYSVANGGKLPAFIKTVKVGMRIGESIPPIQDEPPIHDLLTAPLIGGGEQRRVIQGFANEGGEPAHECEIRGGMALIPGSAFKFGRVIVKISIEYDGPITTGHTTTACWEWHPVKYAFTQYGGPEHNQRT
jgi:hypothetical protein